MAAEWVTAWSTLALAAATAALAVGGGVAGYFAWRAYHAQRDDLAITRRDSKRQRTPVLLAELSTDPGATGLWLTVRLSTSEPLPAFHLILDETRAGDCPLGFTTGQTGVETHIDPEAAPPGWKNDPHRPEARWTDTLLPGSAALFHMALRQPDVDKVDPSKIRMRADCIPIEGGEPWHISVPVTVTKSAADKLPHGHATVAMPRGQIARTGPDLGQPRIRR